MKLSKREKILLILLAVIIIVGMFYIYGIMPAKDNIIEQEKAIEKLEDELNVLKGKLIKYNSSSTEKKIDKCLYDYYANNFKIWNYKIDTELERDLIKFFEESGIEVKDTTGWGKKDKVETVEIEGSTMNVNVSIASVLVDFEFESMNEVKDVIDKANLENSIVVNAITTKIKEVEDEENQETKIIYEGQMSVSIIMIDDNANLPKEIDNLLVAEVNYDKNNNTISFNDNEIIKDYVLYEKVVNEENKIEYLKANLKYKKIDNNVVFDLSKLEMEKGEHQFVVELIGDRKEFFKSLIQKCNEDNIIKINVE